jgi:hypothetical protein
VQVVCPRMMLLDRGFVVGKAIKIGGVEPGVYHYGVHRTCRLAVYNEYLHGLIVSKS